MTADGFATGSETPALVAVSTDVPAGAGSLGCAAAPPAATAGELKRLATAVAAKDCMGESATRELGLPATSAQVTRRPASAPPPP